MRIHRVSAAGRGPIWVVAQEDELFEVDDVFGERRLGARVAGECLPLVCVAPSKIVCIGRNYAEHARELGNEVPEEPTLFLKPPSSLLGAGEPIVRPRAFSQVLHHEGELGIVVGRRLRNASVQEAEDAIWGLVPANDVTARDLQRADKTWARGKGFDSFCPVGPAVVPAETAPAITDLRIRVRVNGQLRQDGSCADMVHPVAACLAYASRVFTLEPGDLLLTGTPEGVGPLVAGDEVSVEIEGIGTLTNPVNDGPRAEELPPWR